MQVDCHLHFCNAREFRYLSDKVCSDGGCEASVTAGTRCWWAKFGECGDLLYARKFLFGLKEAVYKSYVRLAILCGSKACCLRESYIFFCYGRRDLC